MTTEQKNSKVSNCIDAESLVRSMCIEINGAYNSEWCKDYFTKTFPKFAKVKMGKILLGIEKGDKSNYYYVPNPF